MKKNISINIGGIIFHIEEDGYTKLRSYLDSINAYFSSFEDSKEIVDDIEGRVAEIFLGKLDEGKQIISIEDVDELIATMGTVKDFEENIDVAPEDEETKKEDINTEESDSEKTKRLYRDKKRVVIGGVASGLGQYLGVDPIWIRLIFLAALLNIGFWGLSSFVFIAYIVLWIAVPGSSELTDDKKIKKLFRSQDDSVLGGICSGLASYFGTDPVLIRVIFVVAIFAGGAGILVYLILWIITPEAKTLTEKMQMQGEPVTLSNIEENVKKSLNVKEGEESPFVRILLFPFRIIATIFKALGESLGPILKFAVEALRIVTGILLILVGFILMIAFTITLAVLLGFGGAWNYYIELGIFSPEDFSEILGLLGVFASYIAFLIPSVALILIGATIIIKRGLVKPYVSWSLFGLWSLSVIILAFMLPGIFGQFRVDNNFREEKLFPVNEETPILVLNKIEEETFNRVELKLRGHGDSLNYKLSLDFESRGENLSDARENAEAIDYNVNIIGSQISFDSDLNFQDAPYRFQSLEATFYIPFNKVFRMDEDLEEILRNTLYPNDYRVSQMNGNDWIFTRNGLKCITCPDEEVKFYKEGTKSFGFEDFDEIKMSSHFDFEIVQSSNYSVELFGDDEYVDDIRIKQRGDELEITSKSNMKWWSLASDEIVKVIISMPELEYLEVSGASQGDVSGFDTREMEFRLTGASEIKADIRPEEFLIDATGASEIRLNGSASEVEINLTGASELNAYSFRCNEVEIRALGASTAKIDVRDYLKASAAGASTIKYRGNPETSVNAAGLSSVKRD